MAKKVKGKPFRDKDGVLYIPYDDGSGMEAYIAAPDVEKMILASNGPNGLSEIIMDWKMQHPTGTKEEFMEQSHFSQETVDALW